jgi:hypothetical protein
MSNIRTPLFLVCLFVCFTTGSQADEAYRFDYTALSGPVESFSFSFTAPTLVIAGTSPDFTPFTLTDGTNSWTMTNDVAEVDGPTGLNLETAASLSLEGRSS